MYQQLTYRITRIDNIQAVFSRKLLPKQHASNFKYNSLDLSPIPDLITWDFSCLVSTKDLEKAFPQKRHLNGFSPVWFRMWSLMRCVCKIFPKVDLFSCHHLKVSLRSNDLKQ